MMERSLEVSNSLMIIGKKVISFGLFLVVVELLTCAAGSLKVGLWNYVSKDDQATFQQVTVEHETGTVFVGGRNSVVKLSGTLKPMAQYRTGPVPVDGTGQVDNFAKILEIDDENSSGILLFCGSARYGSCSVLSSNDLSAYTSALDADSPSTYLAGTETVFAFFGGEFFNASRLLHVARTYDVRPVDRSTFALSSFNLLASNSSAWQLRPVASIDFEPSARSRYLVRYVYGFEHGAFVYFVTVQRESTSDDDLVYETKLVRICRNGSKPESYTELSLNCRQKTSVATYLNVALAAHLGPLGSEFSKRFAYSAGETALYVLMARSEADSWVPDPGFGSGLCVFSMTEVRAAFAHAQSDCYQGNGRLLSWVTYMEPLCSKNLDIASHIDDSFCGSPVNVGIGSRYPLTTETNFTIAQVATSLTVVFHGEKSVAVVGTEDGYLLKVLIDGMHSAPYLVLDISAGLDRRHPVASDMTFDPTNEHLYVLNGPKISRVPLYSCAVYDDCASCITTPDPLGCGWCDDHCSTKDQCASLWSNEYCLPVIISFHPESGPVSGGTKVTITGKNFGSGNQSIDGVSVMVKVATTECNIEFHNDSCIVCLTGQSVRGPVVREVKVAIIDLSKTAVNFDIRGSASTIQEGFAYKVPSVVSVTPLMGPKSGGTQVTINGQHLDIGSNRSVTTAACPCYLVRVSSSTIVCNTSTFCAPNSSKFPSLFFPVASRSPVSVTIDGSLLNVKNSVFVYMDDPVISNVFPLVSFLSGGIPVTVTGSNLHVTRLSSLCVKITSEAHTFCEICRASENGSIMICRTPNITLSGPVATDNSPLGAEYFLSMDGMRKVISSDSDDPLRNTILYYTDPVLSVFPGPRAMREFYDDEDYLEVQGNYLDLAASQSNYQVTIGGSDCSIVHLTAAALICRPKKPESVDEAEMYRTVQVYIGNLVFTVGSLKYAKRHENLLVVATAVPIASAVCLLTVVVFAVWTCSFCAGHRKSKDRISFIEVPNTRVGTVMADVQLDNPSHLEPVFDAEIWSDLLESNMLIENNSLTILDIIGQGHFGCVYRGTIQPEADKGLMEVAVKTIKASTEDAFTNAVLARKFVDEALRMKKFNHPHVLQVIGVSLGKDDIPLVILPFMKHGDLLSYLRNADNSPTVRDLMEFCIEIADGMDYLAGLKFVHRDLAARNCMLDDCMQVKVADFGLSRDIYERNYYSSDDRKACLPVKWMSPESLEKGIYNAKTDVWSYGVVLWELMTRGVSPYPEVDNWDVIKFLKSGRRLPQPTYCPDSLYQAMLSCWHLVASLRPSFGSLKLALNEIINSMETETTSSTRHSSNSSSSVTYINVPNSLDYLVPNADQRQRQGQGQGQLRLVVIK